jgi:hypothetical protein
MMGFYGSHKKARVAGEPVLFFGGIEFIKKRRLDQP